MIRQIAVIGAGTMGHSIAENFAIYGFSVSLFDTSREILDKAHGLMEKELQLLEGEGLLNGKAVGEVISNITLYDDLNACAQDADYVIEAVPENLALKQDLFRQLDGCCREEAIFASNTSSLILADIMAHLPDQRKQRTMICHWYNPALLMPIAELSFFGNMPEPVYTEVEKLYQSINKQVVKVLKEVPGLVANRIQQAVAREVFSLMEMEVASPEDIDRALTFGPAFRYATTGQLQVADFGGLDIWCTVGDNLLPEIDNSSRANQVLRAKVRQGELGFKTGKGFFDYCPEDRDRLREAYTRKLIHQLKASQFYM